MQTGIEAAIDLLARLVAARSPNPPGDERLVADVIIGAAEALALPKGAVHAADPARPNLIFHIGHGSPNLLLAAHMAPPACPSRVNNGPPRRSSGPSMLFSMLIPFPSGVIPWTGRGPS